MAEKIQTKTPGTRGMRVAEKSKNFKKAYADLFRYVGKYHWLFIVASVLALAGSGLNLVGPNLLSQMTDMILEGIKTTVDVESVGKLGILLAIFYIFGALLNYSQSFIMVTLSQRITQMMRRSISQKINKLPLNYFDTTTTGDVMSRVTNDVDTVGQMLTHSFANLVSASAMLIGSITLMFITEWRLALAGIATATIGVFLMVRIINHSQKYFMQQQTELGGLNGHVEETYSGHSVIRAYNGEKAALDEFHDRNNRLYTCAWKSQFLSGMMMPLMGFIGNLAYVVVCIFGAVLAMRGDITFGVIVAFMVYIRLFTHPIQTISQASNNLQSLAAAWERVYEFLSEPEMEDESAKTDILKDVKGHIAFDHVRFGYNPEKIIVHDFSFDVHPGHKIAIVGPSGAGKTTMVNLLMRFYELNGGKITIDNVPLSELTRTNIHDLFGMVLQDTWLFEGSVRENLVFNESDITDERLDEVCAATGLTEFVKQLPNGYDTILGDSASISAGQKQLLTIARAMVENSPLIILDEATSSVDTRTEQQVQKAMDMLTHGRTSFVIAHRLSTIKNANCILVMKDGDIIESGSHDELMQKGSFYADLYNSQFEPAN